MNTLLARPVSRLIHAFRQNPLRIRSTARLSSSPAKPALSHLENCRGIYRAPTPFGESSIMLFKLAAAGHPCIPKSHLAIVCALSLTILYP